MVVVVPVVLEDPVDHQEDLEVQVDHHMVGHLGHRPVDQDHPLDLEALDHQEEALDHQVVQEVQGDLEGLVAFCHKVSPVLKDPTGAGFRPLLGLLEAIPLGKNLFGC